MKKTLATLLLATSASADLVDGSFENIKFLPRPNEILSLLENPSLHDKEYDHYVSLITKEKPLIIHIRLTDYLNFSHFLNTNFMATRAVIFMRQWWVRD